MNETYNIIVLKQRFQSTLASTNVLALEVFKFHPLSCQVVETTLPQNFSVFRKLMGVSRTTILAILRNQSDVRKSNMQRLFVETKQIKESIPHHTTHLSPSVLLDIKCISNNTNAFTVILQTLRDISV